MFVDFGRGSGGDRMLARRGEKIHQQTSRSALRPVRCVPASIDCPTMSASTRPRRQRKRHTRRQASVPQDLDAIELHDAMAPAELMLYERLGLCGPGEGPKADRRRRNDAERPRTGQSKRRALLARTSGRRDRTVYRSPSLSGKCAAKPASGRSRNDRRSPWRKIRAVSCLDRTPQSIAARS